MILPTTQKFMINHLGFFYVLKYPHNVRGDSVVNWLGVGWRLGLRILMINHLGFCPTTPPPSPPPLSLQTPEGPPKKWDTKVNPLLLLDYRCHVDNGTIGTNLPPQV